MQTSISTNKLLRQRSFLSSLIPLFALFIGLGASQKAMGQAAYSTDDITISASTNGGALTTQTYVGRGSGTPKFNGRDLGMGLANGGVFIQTGANAGNIYITAASASLLTFPSTSVTDSRLSYRVYATASAVLPTFKPLTFTLTSANTSTSPVTYATTLTGTSRIDLLQEPAVLGGGNYTVEIVYESTVMDPNGTSTLSDPGGTAGGYRATFQVAAPLVTPPNGLTRWISTAPPTGSTGPFPAAGPNSGNTNWFEPLNWSNGVPTRFSDAEIPGKTQSPRGTAPVLNVPALAYEVRNLTLLESSNSSRALLTITTATLTVFGDLNQPGGGVTASTLGTPGFADPTQNSTIVFAGLNDQVIRGSLIASDVRIEGSGLKSVTNRLTIGNTMTLNPANPAIGVVLQSAVEAGSGGPNPVLLINFDTSTNQVIDLDGAGQLIGPLVNPAGPITGARLPAETNVTFVLGVLRSNRRVIANTLQSFGNIGLDITADKSTVAVVTVTRIVGDALIGPVGSSATAVKRQFQVLGEVNSTDTGDPNDIFTSTVVFHYLDSTTGYNELNGNTNENNLVLFRTVNGSIPFVPLNGTANPSANTVTRGGLTLLRTLTLGDRLNPLPVSLASFDAKRAGADAMVTWQTASEQNNKGYEVQVSTTGTEFRTLGFVGSVSPNSTSRQSYSFVDKEANKAGIRYYRLHQIDLDGKETFFAPVAVNFEGKASVATSTMVAYPNPFNGNDDVRIALQSTTVGTGKLLVTDMMGRTIRQQNIELNNGLTDVSVAGLKDLKSGLYMVKLTMPSGEVKNLKVQKQ